MDACPTMWQYFFKLSVECTEEKLNIVIENNKRMFTYLTTEE